MNTQTPADIVESLTALGAKKALLPRDQMLIRGVYSGLLLGIATTLAVTVAVQSGQAWLGALAFPVGFTIIILLGMELVTGNFAVIPMSVWAGHSSKTQMMENFKWVILGNLLGSLAYAMVFSLYISKAGHVAGDPIIAKIVSIAESKTLAYQKLGAVGMVVLLAKAVVCNWMVSMGVVMAFVTTSASGRILAIWMPIFTFFALGLEHCVVNMFVIPAGMMLGADVDAYQWLWWNQIPVIFGNYLGAKYLTGWFLMRTHGGKKTDPAPAA